MLRLKLAARINSMQHKLLLFRPQKAADLYQQSKTPGDTMRKRRHQKDQSTGINQMSRRHCQFCRLTGEFRQNWVLSSCRALSVDTNGSVYASFKSRVTTGRESTKRIQFNILLNSAID